MQDPRALQQLKETLLAECQKIVNSKFKGGTDDLDANSKTAISQLGVISSTLKSEISDLRSKIDTLEKGDEKLRTELVSVKNQSAVNAIVDDLKQLRSDLGKIHVRLANDQSSSYIISLQESMTKVVNRIAALEFGHGKSGNGAAPSSSSQTTQSSSQTTAIHPSTLELSALSKRLGVAENAIGQLSNTVTQTVNTLSKVIQAEATKLVQTEVTKMIQTEISKLIQVQVNKIIQDEVNKVVQFEVNKAVQDKSLETKKELDDMKATMVRVLMELTVLTQKLDESSKVISQILSSPAPSVGVSGMDKQKIDGIIKVLNDVEGKLIVLEAKLGETDKKLGETDKKAGETEARFNATEKTLTDNIVIIANNASSKADLGSLVQRVQNLEVKVQVPAPLVQTPASIVQTSAPVIQGSVVQGPQNPMAPGPIPSSFFN